MDLVLHELVLSFTDPGLLFGHFTYLLLIVSMLMRRMSWLRGIAIVAGIAKIIYRTAFVLDPVSVLWESLFVLVNATELALLWWRNRPPAFGSEERAALEAIAPGLSPAAARALLGAAKWRDAAAGARLTTEGTPVGGLIFIADGAVEVTSGGRHIARCESGDFLGEMTWTTGAAATATTTALGQVRYVWFDRERLTAVLRTREVLRYALQASFSRNLIQKLQRASS